MLKAMPERKLYSRKFTANQKYVFFAEAPAGYDIKNRINRTIAR